MLNLQASAALFLIDRIQKSWLFIHSLESVWSIPHEVSISSVIVTAYRGKCW